MLNEYDTIENGSLLCYTTGEARLFRQAGYTCITVARLRRILYGLLSTGGNNAPQIAAESITRCLASVTDEVHPEKWTGIIKDFGKEATEPIFSAIASLPVTATLLRNPADPFKTGDGQRWKCSGTTVLVAQDTLDLVRAADTYVDADCYRHTGRMDDPFVPTAGRVCLVTDDELRLIRLDGLLNPEVVIVSSLQITTGLSVTPWSSSLRTLCGEFPGLRVGVAECLRVSRKGKPFFLGITRGVGYISHSRADEKAGGAVDYRIDFDGDGEENDTSPTVRCRGGLDVHRLIRYGGMRIYTNGGGKRRKIQLKSLGLARAGKLAGVYIYDLDANRPVLEAWLATRTLAKPARDYRSVMIRRERVRGVKQASPKSMRGAFKHNSNHPSHIKVTPSTKRQAASILRKMTVIELKLEEGGKCGVTVACLGELSDGGVYLLNGRAAQTREGKIVPDQKRCKIRCPMWQAQGGAGMLAWLVKEPHVIMAGLTESGKVFAVVKLANGTEDQQTEAVTRWSEEAGRLQRSGACPWLAESINRTSVAQIKTIHHTNWRAESLETACFERYQTAGDYSKPLKLARRGVATLSERAAAYADTVEGLDEEGMRNSCLSSAILNIRSKFGREALTEVLPRLLEKSTLPSKEKNKMAIRMLHDRGAAARKEAP